MSDLLRVGFVAEGPTDYVALHAAVRSLLGDVDFTPTLISPMVDESLAVQTGGGWTKVYLWCKQMLGEAGGDARKSDVCIPSYSIETWVLVALFPDDPTAVKPNIECRRDCEVRLKTHGLIKSGKKLIKEYRANEDGIADAWGHVRECCGEAERFSEEFLALVPSW